MKPCIVNASLVLAILAVAAVAQDRLLPQPPPCIFANCILVRCASDGGTISLIQNGTRRHILNLETVSDLIGENTPVDYNDNGTCSAIRKCPAGPDISSASQVVSKPTSSGTQPQRPTTTTTTTNPIGGATSSSSARGCPSSALIREDSYYAPNDPANTLERLFEIGSVQECYAECASRPPCSYFIYCKDEDGRCSSGLVDDFKTCRLFTAPSKVVNRTSWSIGVGDNSEWDAGYLNAS